jgi:sec-independent protein translocase protein TatB
MFDVGFWELLLIAVLCLIVVGPQRLPRLARTVGAWVGRAKLLGAQVKAEVDREIDADALREQLKDTARETEQAARDIGRTLDADDGKPGDDGR